MKWKWLSRWREITFFSVLFEVSTVLFNKEKFDPGKCWNTTHVPTVQKHVNWILTTMKPIKLDWDTGMSLLWFIKSKNHFTMQGLNLRYLVYQVAQNLATVLWLT